MRYLLNTYIIVRNRSSISSIVRYRSNIYSIMRHHPNAYNIVCYLKITLVLKGTPFNTPNIYII